MNNSKNNRLLKKNRQWLILAHCYNMDGRAASQTITDRIPFLLDHGVKPIVISAPTGRKESLFPHYQVFSPAPSGLKFELRHFLKKDGDMNFYKKIVKLLLTLLLLPLFLVEKILLQLDSHWSWFLSASFYGAWIVRKQRPELIYSTAGPSSTHYAGYILKKIYNLPWIAELHDPLIYDSEKNRWHKYFFNKYLEKLIFKNADKIIYFTERAGSRAAERNSEGKENMVIIRPGASPPDTWEQNYQKQEKMHLGYFGSLAPHRNLKVVCKAVHELFREKPGLSNKIVLNIYGTALDKNSAKAIDKYTLKDAVFVHGRLEYDPITCKTGRQQILEVMKRMDVLILVHGDDLFRCDEYIPSKLYDYMLVKRPILGLTHPGSELQKMLELNGFTAADCHNVAEVKEKINNLFEIWNVSGLPDLEKSSHLTVENAVQQLMEIREGLLDKALK